MGKHKKDEPAGLAFVGFLILGLAVGIYINQTAVGVLAGLALGFISMAILKSRK
ncbi:MAG: hypothetical protein ISS93_02625 [Candidatus Aenigmarchaeota archaeon]|nr:hypothetical protein [Candidatus Aenigmarchaeota archaeon]